jgi:uncharacterized membrane protein YccC
MKTALPWLLAIVLGAGAFFFFQKGQKKSAEIAALETQLAEIESLRSENEDLQRVAAQMGELERLRRDAEEVLKLRGDVTRLRDQVNTLQGQLQQAQAAGAQSQARLQQHTQQMQQQASAIQQVQAQQQVNICVNHLRQIDGAKQQWALENRKTALDVPQPQDLMPFFQSQTLPQCPAGGVYTLNAVRLPPACNIAGHSLPQTQQ